MSSASKYLFFMGLLMSSIMGIMMKTNILVWMMMELNLLCFIPLMSLCCKFNPHMLGLKYFLVQTLGSIIVFFSFMFLILLNKMNMFNMLISLALLWKSGMPPFHFWFFSFSIMLDWMGFFILSSWQKILPFSMLSKLSGVLTNSYISLAMVISIMGSINQSSLKKLLVYSSIFMGGWMIASFSTSSFHWLMILMLYSVFLFMFVLLSDNLGLHFKESGSMKSLSLMMKYMFFLLLANLSGIPPFSSFFMKIMVLQSFLFNWNMMIVFILMWTSMFLMFMYINLFLVTLAQESMRSSLDSYIYIYKLLFWSIFLVNISMYIMLFN